jgi:hypothetical protein
MSPRSSRQRPSRSAVQLNDLIPYPGERTITVGGSRAGKSAHLEWTMRTVAAERPTSMNILVDTKPRYRAETMPHPLSPRHRVSAERLYKNWTAGPTVPNSVRMNIWSDKPFAGLFNEPGEIVIMQGETLEEWKRMLVILNHFVRVHKKDRERNMWVDEALDFYQRNSWGINGKNDVFYRSCRAGGERGIGTHLGLHRLKGTPQMILNQITRCTLFHLVSDSDMSYLRESIGIKDAESPEGDYVFRQWTRKPGGAVSEPVTGTLALPESYLSQLSST